MSKRNRTIWSLFEMVIFSVFFISLSAQKIQNCQLYNISLNGKQVCSKCLFGYELNEQQDCQPNKWLRVISLGMAIKYVEPFIQFRSIFIDFLGEFWFLAANQNHSTVSNKLSQFIITMNNQRLWPCNIKKNFDNFLGKQRIQRLQNILGLKEQLYSRDQLITKKDLFLLDKESFSFTSTCILRLLCSFGISFTVWIGLQFIDGLIFLLTDHRLLEKKQIKGAFILMVSGQFYHFVGFYGFYQIKNFEGFQKIGMKINLLLTIFVVFLFLFMSICLHPLLYSFALTNQEDIQTDHLIQEQRKEANKVHRILTFANSAEGYLYFLVNSYFRQFFTGCIIGYFYDQSFHFLLLVLWYVCEFILLDVISDTLDFNIYFIFRKGFILVTIFYLLLCFEQNVHMFSYSSQSFQPVLGICLSLLFVFGVMEFLFKFVECSQKVIQKIRIWLKLKKSKNKIRNLDQKNTEKENPKRRKVQREPSIAQKVLKTLKSMKGL